MLRALALVSIAAAALVAGSACHGCPTPQTHANQCADRAALWGKLSDGGAAQPRCPTIGELENAYLGPYDVGLEGNAFVDGPASTPSDQCCYTTESGTICD